MVSSVRTCLLAALVAALALLAPAQETRGTIFGHVIDPNGGAIAGANVIIANIDTNIVTDLQTNESGYYNAERLVAGNYRVEVEAPGFAKTLRKGLVLPIGTRLQVDLKLEVGSVSESVTVSAGIDMVNTDTLSSGAVTEAISATDLPNPGNNTMVMAKFTAGIQSDQSASDWSVRLHSTGAASSFSAYGKASASNSGGGNEYSVDGLPNNGTTRGPGDMPASELVQAMKVETSGFDASMGHGAGVTVMVMTKAGTNKWHGNLKESYHNARWNALDFFSRQAYQTRIAQANATGNTALAQQLQNGNAHQPGQLNNYAATIGGPVILPKLFNGRNKLFFFFGFAGFHTVQYTTSYNQVPTAAMRQGDFSSLLKVVVNGASQANQYQIYDPYSTVADSNNPGHVIRAPFAGNIVPSSRIINPTYNFYTKLLQLPNNINPDPAHDPSQNFISINNPNKEWYNSFANRFDYNQSDKDRFMFRWSRWYWKNRQGQMYTVPEMDTPLNYGGAERRNLSLGVDWVHTINGNNLIDVAVGSNEWRIGSYVPGFQQFKPSDAGFPAYLDTLANFTTELPDTSISGWSGFTKGSLDDQHSRVHSGKIELSHMSSRHTLKAGVDGRLQFMNRWSAGANAGSFAYNSTWTKSADNTGTFGVGNYGPPWASFMMGLPATIAIDTNTSAANSNPFFATYIQDNWRLTPRLSLNLGLRLEYEAGPTERYNRLVSGFDPTLVLPISAGAQAAYATAPVSGVPASQFSALGGNTYPAVNGLDRQQWSSSWNLMPRIALAYQLDRKSVLRFGTGRFFDTLNVGNELNYNQTGFSNTTNTTLSNDNGLTWSVGNPAAGISPLTNPFPVLGTGARLLPAIGSSLGAMTLAGKGYTYIPYNRPHAAQSRWRLDVQRMLDNATAITVGYSGSYTNHIPLNMNMSPVPAQDYWFGNSRNDATANAWNANVANPFLLSNFSGLQTSNPTLYTYMANNSFFTSKTIQAQKLWVAFPQMNGLTQTTDLQKTKTEELDVSFQRRFAKGFNVNMNYTRLWSYAADYFPNPFDRSPAFEPTNTGRPHRLVSTAVIQVPVGKGRKFLQKGPLSWVLGGYQVSVIQEYQPGSLISWSSTLYYTGSNFSDLCNGPQTLGKWFDTSLFQSAPSLVANTGQARVMPNYISGYGSCRAMPLKNFNGSISRQIAFNERANLQLRVDAYNVGNHMQFNNAPNTTPTSSQFGQMTSQNCTTCQRAFVFTGRISF
ncbi:MAG: hypothetical protein JWP63_4405 [Candidatus Solibacter sp.]|nr:hypothetical protein [Candidatus Solibacter sp.]